MKDEDLLLETNRGIFSYRIAGVVIRDVDSLKSRDLEGVSQFFTPEGSNDIYPLSNAEKIVGKYSEMFDLDTIGYELIDINKNEYVYDIYGIKEDQNNTHQIEIKCGNGLCCIRDEWAPGID